MILNYILRQDSDIVLGGADGRVKYLENTAAVTAGSTAQWAVSLDAILAKGVAKPAFTDLNGDGDHDMILFSEVAPEITYWRNVGSANEAKYTWMEIAASPLSAIGTYSGLAPIGTFAD